MKCGVWGVGRGVWGVGCGVLGVGISPQPPPPPPRQSPCWRASSTGPSQRFCSFRPMTASCEGEACLSGATPVPACLTPVPAEVRHVCQASCRGEPCLSGVQPTKSRTIFSNDCWKKFKNLTAQNVNSGETEARRALGRGHGWIVRL